MTAEATDVPAYGPAMTALPDKRRKFVESLYHEGAPSKGDGLLIYAARAAGYGNAEGTSSNKVLSVIASRLIQDAAVTAAIAEYSRGLVRAISPEVVRAVRNLVRDPKDKNHARALSMILDRVDPIETKHTVAIEDHRPPSEESIERVTARIEELMLRAGLLPKPALLIEAKAE